MKTHRVIRMSIARFLTIDGEGNVSLLKEHSNWRDTWQILVPVDHWGELTKILLYDRFSGDAKFLATNGEGDVSPFWPTTLAGRSLGMSSFLVQFVGTTSPSLLLYRRDVGEAKILTTTANGNVALLKQHTDWNTIWDIVVPRAVRRHRPRRRVAL